MAQTRKQKVLQQVQRQRRQRTIITATIVAVLIAIIVGAILFLPKPAPDPIQLPPYLDHCVTANLVYHSHPNLAITVGGIAQTLPDTFETQYDAGCSRVMHTHDSTGVIHVETDQDVNYTLGDWFLIWGHWAGSTTTAAFNSTQIFNNKVGNGHTLGMTVNGSVDTNPADFKGGNPAVLQNLWIPRDAVTGQNNCYPVPNTGCIPFNIAITYT
jgi:hypothetical protein